MGPIDGVEVDAQRAVLAAEVVRLNGCIHDRAIGLVGPMPVPADLTIQQLRVLDHVVKRPGLSGQELGGLLGVSAPTGSGLVDRMVEKGLVSRTDDPDDRRVRRLRPTEAGLAVMRELDSMFGRALGVVLGELSTADLELLRQGARVMLAAVERVRARGEREAD
ncbi:MarR family winged helix-turn-helix transcriptional regulator [Micropruina sp.]|uniref:MarR family winged helix-turn-helix transcriptional regulator n=1 Tax=Micropruina sp. TaxID=2737536 RepID=UPI0039E5DB39